jgi:hypothetical protein
MEDYPGVPIPTIRLVDVTPEMAAEGLAMDVTERADVGDSGRGKLGKIVLSFPRLQCPSPYCGAFDPRVIRCDWPVRCMQCRVCGFQFQTYDHGPRRGGRREGN